MKVAYIHIKYKNISLYTC